MPKKSRIGVYICHCGGNISDTVDVAKVKEAITKIDGVEVAETNEYVCSNPGQEMIQRGIKEHGLNRVVVASCSPRMHLDTFRQVVDSAGLNPYLLEMTNIREQCSWSHDDKEAATAMAISLIRGAIERARYLEPLTIKSLPVKKEVLVIGGGIAGIYAATELADNGYQVYIIEKSPSIGGHMAQLSKTFPTLDCSACILTPKMVDVSQHPNVKIITNAEVTAVEGSPGDYHVLVQVKPRYVDEEKCTACGECTKYCPVKKPSSFEEGLMLEKAIDIPFPQAIPNIYKIDKDFCLFFSRGVCRLCEKFCKGNAIDFEQKEERLGLNVGAIIVCTGYDQVDLSLFSQYNFGQHPDIITNLQFERLMLQGMHRPSNGEEPKKVAFILCVGSRSTCENGREFCCKIGCMNALKHALLLTKAVPDAEPWIFYTDIRAHGKGYEEFYANIRDHGAKFIRGRAAQVVPVGDKIRVTAEDTLLGMRVEELFDMVVLSPALIPSPGTEKLAEILGIDLGPDTFFLERHHKLKGVETKREGIYIAGCSQGPKDIRETTMESLATASKVSTFLGKGQVSVSPEVAYITPEKCDSCALCVEICPVKAVETLSDESKIKVDINPISCVGCGICVQTCPQEAIDLHNFSDDQLIAQIHGALESSDISPKILVFLEGTTAYGSLDLAGQTRQSFPPNILPIRVPSTGRLTIRHLLHAFAAGADGVALIEGDDSVFDAAQLRSYITKLKKELRNYDIEPLRLMSTTTTLPQFDKVINFFNMFNDRITKMKPFPKKKREKILEEVGAVMKVKQ